MLLVRPILGWAQLASLLQPASLSGLSSSLYVDLTSVPCVLILGPGIKGKYYLWGLLLILLGAVDHPGHLLSMAMAEAPERRQKL